VSLVSAPQRLPGGKELLLALERERTAIVGAAVESLRHSRTHYGSASEAEIRQPIESLYDELLAAVARRDLGDVIDYARDVAAERFRLGYDLSEVQAAINTLEEATWSTLCAQLEPEHLALSLGLVSTIFGAAKDALAQAYVSLAAGTHAPSLDLRALFTGGTVGSS